MCFMLSRGHPIGQHFKWCGSDLYIEILNKTRLYPIVITGKNMRIKTHFEIREGRNEGFGVSSFHW